MSTSATHSLAVDDRRPPLVVGVKLVHFVTVGDSPRESFYCPVHAPRGSVFPSTTEQVWRGEVPAGAACCECGLVLAELQ